eukprot:GFYU01009427.1.p2 GENE.GFYU01009427.1~~GFYU01009427.1.p2  ORF type:complete len:230 (+),score=91.07 GFYU01009427.1:40-690(+)
MSEYESDVGPARVLNEVTNYVDQFDIVTWFGHHNERVCKYKGHHSGTSHLSSCGATVGYGTTLGMPSAELTGDDEAKTVQEAFKECRYWTHWSSHYRYLAGHSMTNDDGTTDEGCTLPSDAAECPDYELMNMLNDAKVVLAIVLGTIGGIVFLCVVIGVVRVYMFKLTFYPMCCYKVFWCCGTFPLGRKMCCFPDAGDAVNMVGRELKSVGKSIRK